MRAALGIGVLLAVAIVGDSRAASVTVPAGGDLQAALNKARPGDTILLEPGATYVGTFVLPVKSGDGVVTLRTAGDEGLPGPGQRIAPDAAPRLAKIKSPTGSAALRTAAGAHDWTMALLEFQANRSGAGDIITLGDGSAAQNSIDRVPSRLVLDRVYVHGDPERGQKRGVALNSADTTITGCYISDIKAIGQDSQAIGGWNGPGPYTIENNYLEAAGENLLFGGSDPWIQDLTPAQIVIRNNVLAKPLAWREPGQPKWQVKNLFELKNARHVIVERNVLEHSWQQAQAGYAVLFTVRNQDGRCEWCQVEDVVFRSNVVRGVAAGIQVLGTDPIHPSRQTNNITIADNLFDGVDKRTWGGDGYFVMLSDNPRDITIDHNTVIQGKSGGVMKISHGGGERIVLTNNITSHGSYGIIGSDHGVGNDSIVTYLKDSTITHNVIAGARASAYPAGNLFPSEEEMLKQFVDPDNHDYRLTPKSKWRGAGTDKRDLGANLSQLPETKVSTAARAEIAERENSLRSLRSPR